MGYNLRLQNDQTTGTTITELKGFGLCRNLAQSISSQIPSLLLQHVLAK